MRQSQALSWLWLAITNNLIWLVLPQDLGLTLDAFCIIAAVILIIIFEAYAPEGPKPYVPKKQWPPKSLWIQALFKAFNSCTARLTKMIMNIRVRRRYQPQQPRTCGKCTRQKRQCHAPFTQVASMTSTWSHQWTTPRARAKQFDSDSHALMLDDGTSACITNCKEDFIESPKCIDRKVKGIKGHANATHRGTLKWYLKDNTGLVHVMVIQGAYLIPYAVTRILSPQHLAQQANDHYPREEGTGSLTTSKSITLFWSQHRFAKTVPLDPRTNVGLTTTAAGARSFHAFCASVDVEETNQTNIFTTHVIPNDEDDKSFQPNDPVAPPAEEEEESVAPPEQSPEPPELGPMTTLVDLGPICQVIPEDPEPGSLDPHDELLRWHYCLGHLPFDQVKQLA